MRSKLLMGGIAALLLVGAGCAKQAVSPKSGDATPKDTSPIQVGWVGPLTGDAASIGNDARAAAEIAVEEVNAAGGADGRLLELVVEDTRCTPEAGANAANSLINLKGVKFIVGGACSGETTAIAPVAEQNKVVLFSYCSSAPNITTAGDYIFRSYPSDAFQGKYGAEYVYNTLGKKNVAVFAVLGDWGTGMKNTFEARYKELGGSVVFSEDYAQEGRDFRTQIAKIKAANPELVYMVGYTEASVAFLKQAKELGLSVPFFGGDAWDDAIIHAEPGAEGIMYTVGNVGTDSPAFVAAMAAKGATNTVCSPGSYNNIKILAEIFARVGTDPESVKNELYKVKDYPGLFGPVTLDQNGDLATASYLVKKVTGGKSAEVK